MDELQFDQYETFSEFEAAILKFYFLLLNFKKIRRKWQNVLFEYS